VQATGVLSQLHCDAGGAALKDTAVVVAALSKHVRKLPATMRCSLTWDRGLEMAKHKDFTVATNVRVCFCDPQSPWQCGSNENTNLLLRQIRELRWATPVETKRNHVIQVGIIPILDCWYFEIGT
jgi:hypothetical protein